MKPRGTLWELLMSTTASLNDRNLNRANGLRLFRWHPTFGWYLGAVCLAYFADGRSSVPLRSLALSSIHAAFCSPPATFDRLSHHLRYVSRDALVRLPLDGSLTRNTLFYFCVGIQLCCAHTLLIGSPFRSPHKGHREFTRISSDMGGVLRRSGRWRWSGCGPACTSEGCAKNWV